MAYEETLKSVTHNADASIAVFTGVAGMPGSPAPNWGFQFRFLKITGENLVGLCVGAEGEVVYGVLQSKPQVLNDAATTALSGISMMQSGAALGAGVLVMPDAVGRPIVAPNRAGASGITVAACTAADQLVPVRLFLS